ncbi:MAG: PAS domain-containing protein [Desulfosarcinaceae bacterium]|nr:PAS domain-containing protein [Desulfosarcinaceae bacterium]
MHAATVAPDQLIQQVFDALPAMVFVVDADVRVQAFNTAAAELLSAKQGAILKKPGGEALGCLNAAISPAGCGHAPACSQCVVRMAVGAVFAGGRAVRRRTRLELHLAGETIEFFALVTASAITYEGRDLALLVIEDFSEIAALKRMIPICCVCKKIREDVTTETASPDTVTTGETSGWSRLEAYFKAQWGVDFSHGYCPECYRSAFDHQETASSSSQVA